MWAVAPKEKKIRIGLQLTVTAFNCISIIEKEVSGGGTKWTSL
jgi:hypothetical protein